MNYLFIFFGFLIIPFDFALLRNCDVCKKSKRGIVKTSIVRSPDVLILHLKRFGMTARWREKIRTRVIFPFTSLDLSPYLAGISFRLEI